MKRKICVVTGSRADYGLLYWVLRDLQDCASVELQIVVTGMHLAPEFGNTVNVIIGDGFAISHRVEMLLASDTPVAIAKSIGLGVIGMSDALERLQPDIVVLLGDRFEIFAAAQACLIHAVPVAHIAGGDTTEGAFDESIRHSITKMAHLHFATNSESAHRILQMGESPASVFTVGSPGLDYIRRTQLLARDELQRVLGAPLGSYNLLVTFHPATLEPRQAESQVNELLAALEEERDATLWFTKPNADTGGRTIATALDSWVSMHPDRSRIYSSLGQIAYLSLMSHVSAVVGNSSSGLYEAPSFRIPTVDIGDRQRSRMRAKSVLHAEVNRTAIRRALQAARTTDCSQVENPYGDGYSAARIVSVLESISLDGLLKKSFSAVKVH